MIAGHEDIYEDLKSVRCLAQTRRLPLLCAARQRFNSMGSKVTHRAVTEHDNANRFGTHSQVTESGQCASFEAQCAATLLHVGKKNQVRQTTEDLPANKQVSEPLRMEIEAKICRMLPCFLPIPFRRPCLWLVVFKKLTKMHHLQLHIYVYMDACMDPKVPSPAKHRPWVQVQSLGRLCQVHYISIPGSLGVYSLVPRHR